MSARAYVRSKRNLGGEFYAFGEGAGEADRLGGLVEGLVAGDAELALEMEVGGGEDEMNAVGGSGLDGAGGGLDVFAFTAGERGDAGPRTSRETARMAAKFSGTL